MLNVICRFLYFFFFFILWKNERCSQQMLIFQKQEGKIRRVPTSPILFKRKSHFFVSSSYRKGKHHVINKFGNKSNILRIYAEENDEEFDNEINQLIKDIEDGKLGKESLQLFKDIEKQKLEEAEELEKVVNERQKKLKADMHNIDDVVNKTDDIVKKSVKDMFLDTSEKEEPETTTNNNTKTKKEKEIEEEKILINKIGKLYDEMDDEVNNEMGDAMDDTAASTTLPDGKLDIQKIKERINSMKGDFSDNPIKGAAKTLLKYKGMLHQPLNKTVLSNGNYLYWRESLHHIECYVPIPPTTRNEDVCFSFQTEHIKLEIVEHKKKVLLINHQLFGKIRYADAYWVLTNDFKENEQHIHLVVPKMGASPTMWEKLLLD